MAIGTKQPLRDAQRIGYREVSWDVTPRDGRPLGGLAKCTARGAKVLGGVCQVTDD